MQSINSLFSNLWTYIVTHKWSKDILRGNILFISLVIIYDLCHFQLAIITGGSSLNFGLFSTSVTFLNYFLIYFSDPKIEEAGNQAS